MATARVLVVAGGGGTPAAINAGGAGAGAAIYNASYTITPQTYSVTVGNGGAPGASHNGENSIFDTITAYGGGYGGTDLQNGGNGGNGGGAGSSGANRTGGTGSQGYNGGNSTSSWFAGTGAGMGGAGRTADTLAHDVGGIGVTYDITGSNVTYSAGGNSSTYIDGSNGTANTGNGANASQETAYAGGSGVVIVRWTTADFGTCSVTGTGNTIDTTTVAGQSIAKFIVSGNLIIVAGASGPANLKSYNTNLKANIKSINTNLIANVKNLSGNM